MYAGGAFVFTPFAHVVAKYFSFACHMRNYEYTVEIGSNGLMVGDAWIPEDPRNDRQRFSRTITAFLSEVQHAFTVGLTNPSFRLQVEDIVVTAFNSRPHFAQSPGRKRQ